MCERARGLHVPEHRRRHASFVRRERRDGSVGCGLAQRIGQIADEGAGECAIAQVREDRVPVELAESLGAGLGLAPARAPVVAGVPAEPLEVGLGMPLTRNQGAPLGRKKLGN